MARQDHSPITGEQIDEFLNGLAQGSSVQAAAGSDAFRRRLYRLRKGDAEFARRWKEAYDEGTDALVHEARRRAVEGVEDFKVIGSGEFQREIKFRRYSDTLLMFLIKQRDPTFRENARLEVTGTGGGPVQVEHRGVKLADVISVARAAGVESGD